MKINKSQECESFRAEYSAFAEKTVKITVTVYSQERRIFPRLARRQRVPTTSLAAGFANGHRPSKICMDLFSQIQMFRGEYYRNLTLKTILSETVYYYQQLQ